MSLILDALKRAERERKLEKAPDLSAIYQEGRLNRRKINPWFWAGGAFLIIFVVVAIISWPKAPSENDLKDKAPKPALADSAKAANAKTAGTASTQAKGSLPKDPSKPLSVAGKTVKDTTPSAPSAQKKRLETPKKAKQALSYIDLPRKKTPELPAVAAPPPKKHIVDPKPVPEPVKQPVVLKSAKKRPTAAAKVVPKAQPKETLPLFDDLPEEIQSVSGPLEINVHMYSPNPPERRVFINMQGYREGDTIGESGFRLVEITSHGIVIDYGKGKALLEVKRK